MLTTATITTEVEERARHLALSVDGPDEAVAASLETAAFHAQTRGAPDAAAELFLLAASRTPPVHMEALRLRRFGAVGNLGSAGDLDGARRLNRRMIDELAPGPGRAHALYTMAIGSWIDLPLVRSFLEQALDEIGPDTPTRAWIIAELSWVAYWACDPAKAVTLAEQALALISGNDVDRLRSALPVRGLAGFVLGQDTSAILERATSFSEPYDYSTLSTPGACLGRALAWTGDLDAAAHQLRRELDAQLDQGKEADSWQIRTDLAEVEYRAGRWPAAGALVFEGYEIVVDTNRPDVLGSILPLKATLACGRGDAATARADALEALAISERLSDRWDEVLARSALGLIELTIGDYARCHA